MSSFSMIQYWPLMKTTANIALLYLHAPVLPDIHEVSQHFYGLIPTMFQKYIINMEKPVKVPRLLWDTVVLSGLWGSVIAPGLPPEPQSRLYSLH